MSIGPAENESLTGRVTRQDVAKAAGVSQGTVSMSLRDDPRIRRTTREKVKMVAQRLNYRPLASARDLARGTTGTIGVIFTEPSSSEELTEVFAPTLKAIIDGLASRGDRLQLEYWPRGIPENGKSLECPRMFRQRCVEGVVVIQEPGPFLEVALGQSDMPYVVLDAYPPFGTNVADHSQVIVSADDYLATKKAVRHLVSLGHRRIAYLGGAIRMPKEGFISFRSEHTERGYASAMAEAGFPAIPGYEDTSDFYDLVERLWTRPEPPTAVITLCDERADALINWLAIRGQSVPGDVSVAALTEYGPARRFGWRRYHQPTITCKERMMYKIGAVGIEKLLAMLEQPQEKQASAFLPPEIIIRESTGPCRKSV